MSASTTLAPIAAAIRAVAAPNPDPPPVIKNTLSLSCMQISKIELKKHRAMD
jgi:hypothetical protein